MRVSVRKTDPGYRPDGWRCTVTLDGREVGECFTADEARGEVHCFAVDENGDVFEDPENPGHLATRVRRGTVRVRIRPE